MASSIKIRDNVFNPTNVVLTFLRKGNAAYGTITKNWWYRIGSTLYFC